MGFLRNIERTFATVRYLKPSQVLCRIGYALRPVKLLKEVPFNGEVRNDFSLVPIPGPGPLFKVDGGQYTVQILNLTKTYRSEIDWADLEFGRLWNYNLQYADFLNQEELPTEIREKLILELYSWLYDRRLRPEPYPASLRIMNVIRFLQQNRESLNHKSRLLDGLNSEIHFLSGRIEYHLSGNHLLENGFALLMGGFFLNHNKFQQAGRNILSRELKEQILDDGAHYERSPMYHSIMMFRVLEAISYLPEDDRLKSLLCENASRMLAWLRKMTFSNGKIAHFNDSTDGMAPGMDELLNLAGICGVPTDFEIPLSESGYRRFDVGSCELIVNTEGIKPDHQPGHAHADSLSFILHIGSQPLIVDPAISTYEAGERRNRERSSCAHNVVTVQDKNSADVWSAFRVGRRPKVTLLEDKDQSLHARMEYKIHSAKTIKQERIFTVKENLITIEEWIMNDELATGRLHFSPSVSIERMNQQSVQLSGGCIIRFITSTVLSKFTYRYNSGFNKQNEAHGISYSFNNKCSFEIKTV